MIRIKNLWRSTYETVNENLGRGGWCVSCTESETPDCVDIELADDVKIEYGTGSAYVYFYCKHYRSQIRTDVFEVLEIR